MRKTRVLVFLSCLLFLMGMSKVDAASAWAVVDADTGRLLMGENEDAQLPIASLTKIWTAYTVLENPYLSETTKMSHEAVSSEGSSLYLKEGMKVSVESLLYGLMLRSGNDAAYALAEHVGGSVDGFVQLMNEKALLHGFERTSFKNPSGLHDDAHLSTAYETGLMMVYAMKNEQFKEIATTTAYHVKIKDQPYYWKNKHRLLHSNPTALAGKTGFTKAAGRTLVTYFEKDDKRIVVVTLNDGNDWQTHSHLAEKTFAEYKKETVAKSGLYQLTKQHIGELQQPIELLLNVSEMKNMQNIVRISRQQNNASWFVYIDGEPTIVQDVTVME